MTLLASEQNKGLGDKLDLIPLIDCYDYFLKQLLKIKKKIGTSQVNKLKMDAPSK